MKEILNHLFNQNTLTKQEAKTILLEIAQGKHSEIQVASFLTTFKMRAITAEELAGFREALLELCVRIDLSAYNTIDVCGTGGDGKHTFNISTLTAFVLAGAGIKVAKHGNYSATSNCGSSNVLEYLGYQFSNDQAKLQKEIETAGICYMHAPLFHPALKNVAPVRKALQFQTFFNMLGPLVNPSSPKNQLVGVFNTEVLDLYHGVFADSDMNYIVLHGDDGYDEISLTSTFSYVSNDGVGKMGAADFGFKPVKQEELFGGEKVEDAAKIFVNILEGKGTKAQNNVIVANAAMGIKCVFQDKTLDECIEEAKESLLSGKALLALKKIIG